MGWLFMSVTGSCALCVLDSALLGFSLEPAVPGCCWCCTKPGWLNSTVVNCTKSHSTASLTTDRVTCEWGWFLIGEGDVWVREPQLCVKTLLILRPV